MRVCEFAEHLPRRVPQTPARRRNGNFDDLDWFCGAYKTIFAKSLPLIRTANFGVRKPLEISR